MDELLLLSSLLVAFLGLVGAFVRAVPGPAFSYAAIWLAYWSDYCYVVEDSLWIFLIVTILIVLTSFFVPQQIRIYVGSSDKAEIGAMVSTVFVTALLLLSCAFQVYDLQSFAIIANKSIFISAMALIAFLGAFVGQIIQSRKLGIRTLRNTVGATLAYCLGLGIKLLFAFYVLFYAILDVIIYYR